jgi:hypothetical protein
MVISPGLNEQINRIIGGVWKDYEHDLNAAIELLRGYRWALDYYDSYGIDHRQGYSLAINGFTCSQFETTPALAVCRGWLAWREVIAAPTAAPPASDPEGG